MSGERNSVLRVETPEGVVFSLPLAGPIARFAALSIDLACIAVFNSLVGTAANALGWLAEDFFAAIVAIAAFVSSIGYGIGCEWWLRGQTLGKRMMRLRVMDEQGLRLQFSQIVIRNLLRIVDMLPMFYLVGGAACMLNAKMQRLGDLAAGTIVVRRPALGEPDLDQLFAGKYNSLRAYPHIEARLRQQVEPAEADIAMQALLRRDELDDTARIDLFRELAAHFRGLAAFPDEAVFGLSDEQFVRNVVDCVYRSR